MKGKKIWLLVLVAFLCIGCASNKEKVMASYDNLNTVMTSNGFNLTDSKSNYADKDYIINSYLAVKDDITIEFIEYDTEDSAEKILKNHIDSFNLLKSTGASEKKENGKNYHKYILISNNQYMTSVRVNNTLMFCKTPLTNKDIVIKVFDDLGY